MCVRNANLLGALALALADRVEATSAAEALVTLYDRGAGSSIRDVASVCALSHSGAVRLIDRLEAAELVERRRGIDQRSAALQLTPTGRRAARRVLAKREANLELTLRLLTDDQQHQLTAIAEVILSDLGAEPEAERRLCRLCDLEACGRRRGECPVSSRRRRPRV